MVFVCVCVRALVNYDWLDPIAAVTTVQEGCIVNTPCWCIYTVAARIYVG